LGVGDLPEIRNVMDKAQKDTQENTQEDSQENTFE
jgi:hypothetical protein